MYYMFLQFILAPLNEFNRHFQVKFCYESAFLNCSIDAKMLDTTHTVNVMQVQVANVCLIMFDTFYTQNIYV